MVVPPVLTLHRPRPMITQPTDPVTVGHMAGRLRRRAPVAIVVGAALAASGCTPAHRAAVTGTHRPHTPSPARSQSFDPSHPPVINTTVTMQTSALDRTP